MPSPSQSHPLHSLQQGHWFKLICGASFQHLTAIRTLSLVYALAGADCIDVAADPAVIRAARAGITAAQAIQPGAVWLMVSLNDGEDPHFRKATFDPQRCPPDCPRPCVPICPAQAIAFSASFSGVREERCYGCGRCLPICPIEQISARSQPATPEVAVPMLQSGQIDALELHTQVGHEAEFQKLWDQIEPVLPALKLLSISCPDAKDAVGYLCSLQELIQPLPCPLIWQADGRPMSGDIGDGTTRATLQYGDRLLESPLVGFVQLAGGTNRQTVPKLAQRGASVPAKTETANAVKTLGVADISGVAYGSYARSLIHDLQAQLEAQPHTSYHLEDYPDLLAEGIRLAALLVEPLKQRLKPYLSESALSSFRSGHSRKKSANRSLQG
jgi:Fe-S-cluster-containing hydrogenase component 2